MTLARYPNVLPNGSWAWLSIDSVRCSHATMCLHAPAAQHSNRFFVVFRASRPPQVTGGLSFDVKDPQDRIKYWNATQAWLHGYWQFDWYAPPTLLPPSVRPATPRALKRLNRFFVVFLTRSQG
jgi:hypothetical protein